METGRLGIYAGFGFQVPFEERLELIRDAGFGATGLWWEERDPRVRELRHRAPEMVRKAGLHLDNLHVPYYACRELWSSDPAERAEALALHLSWIGDCARHGIPHLVMHVSLGRSTPEPSQYGLDSFTRLIGEAGERGVVLAIENTRDDRYLHYLLGHFDSPALGLCFDTSHDRLHADPQGQLLVDWPDRLVTLHLSDTDGRLDRHWLPGEGVVDFTPLEPCIGQSYQGVYMLECVPKDRSEAPRKFLSRAFESFQFIFAERPEHTSR